MARMAQAWPSHGPENPRFVRPMRQEVIQSSAEKVARAERYKLPAERLIEAAGELGTVWGRLGGWGGGFFLPFWGGRAGGGGLRFCVWFPSLAQEQKKERERETKTNAFASCCVVCCAFVVAEVVAFSSRREHTHPRVLFCVSSVFVLEFSGSLTNVHLCGSLNIPVTNSVQSRAAHFLF